MDQPSGRPHRRKMGQAGAFGIGQSSWGPTGFAFTPREEIAASASMILSKPLEPRARNPDCPGAQPGRPSGRIGSHKSLSTEEEIK